MRTCVVWCVSEAKRWSVGCIKCHYCLPFAGTIISHFSCSYITLKTWTANRNLIEVIVFYQKAHIKQQMNKSTDMEVRELVLFPSCFTHLC